MEIDEEGANGMGEFIRVGITGNGKYDLFKVWKYIASHSMSHNRYLVWEIHEGVQVKDGSYK